MKNRSLIALATVLAAALAPAPHAAAGPGPDGHGPSVEVSIVAGARSWRESNRWTADVVSRDGMRLYRLERTVPYDFPFPTLTVAADGSGILLDAAQGIVEFIDPRGGVAAGWRPFTSPIPSYERIIKCSIGDGAAAFLLSEPGGTVVRVVSTDMRGRILREVAMPGTTAGEILLADDGGAVIASATVEGESMTHVTRMIGREGETRLELPMLFRTGDIHAASGWYAFADRYAVVGGRLEGEEAGYRVDIGSDDRIVTAVRCGPGGALAVAESIAIDGGIPAFRDAEVIVLDTRGAVVRRIRFASSSLAPASVSREGEDFVVRAGATLERIRGIL
jgi:hypothetical protein